MTVSLVHVYVLPEFIEVFIRATKANHEASVREPGNLRFDILQDASDPAKFILYEAYATEAAAAAHKETAHYEQWREAVAPWMAQPRQGIKHHLLYPNS